MTDVSVHQLLSMVHTAPDDGPRPVQDPSGPVDGTSSVDSPPPSPNANDKVESSDNSKRPRQQKSVSSDGGPVRETLKRPKDHRIHRYSPIGIPKPAQTARVVRMVERARREFETAQSPYHPKHARPAIPTQEAMQSAQMGHAYMERLVRDGVPGGPPGRVPGQARNKPPVVGDPTVIRTRPLPPQSRMKSTHDRIIDAEFNRDVSQCLVVHGGRALGLERSRCETSGLKALVEKNIAAFETQSDAIKLGCLLIAKKLNQLTEKWVGSE